MCRYLVTTLSLLFCIRVQTFFCVLYIYIIFLADKKNSYICYHFFTIYPPNMVNFECKRFDFTLYLLLVSNVYVLYCVNSKYYMMCIIYVYHVV